MSWYYYFVSYGLKKLVLLWPMIWEISMITTNCELYWLIKLVHPMMLELIYPTREKLQVR